MIRAVGAGICYFAAVFAIAFMVGTFRVLVMVPWLGPAIAVAMEVPVVILVSWLLCRWIVNRFALPCAVAPRMIMGGLAFLLLMVAEFGLSVFMFARLPGEYLASFATVAGLLGLSAQIVFGLMPLIIRCRESGNAAD